MSTQKVKFTPGVIIALMIGLWVVGLGGFVLVKVYGFGTILGVGVLIAIIGASPFLIRKYNQSTVGRDAYRKDVPEYMAAQTPARRRGSTAKGLGGSLPSNGIEFFGVGVSLDLGRGMLHDPMVYVTDTETPSYEDASLINGRLPVAPPGTPPDRELGYWPSYDDCTASQRAYYLDWLLSGKCDPAAPLGYVFIYFYGLERRLLIDHQDHESIFSETSRLLGIYSESNSFRRYAVQLLCAASALAPEHARLDRAALVTALSNSGYAHEELLQSCLAYFYKQQLPLPVDIAFVVARSDRRTSQSVIIRRHVEEFRKLFDAKYRERFGEGMKLRASKRPLRMPFRPASATLSRYFSNDHSILPELPNVMGITSQFKPLVSIWESCIEELRSFSRAARTADEGEITAEMYEALPSGLRAGEHPSTESWLQIKNQHAEEEGWSLAPISAFAQQRGIGVTARLTKAECEQLLTTADSIGIGIEPDARLTGAKYAWDELVAVFFLQDDGGEDMSPYLAAATMLRLALTIADADGSIDEEELAFIADHLESQFDLTEGQSKRLDQLRHLLVQTKPSAAGVRKMLERRLTVDQRRVVGRFLVGVAAVDGVITQDEHKALKKAYRSLGLEPADLDEFTASFRKHRRSTEPVVIQEARRPLSAGETIPPPPSSETGSAELVLDMDKISEIMRETKQVRNILAEAMGAEFADDRSYDANESESESESIAPVSKAPVTQVLSSPASKDSPTVTGDYEGLPSLYHGFLGHVLHESQWSASAIKEAARQHGLMLAGALDAINEWSYEKYGDALIEEGETFQVFGSLLGERD